jgi:hypothetical protein
MRINDEELNRRILRTIAKEWQWKAAAVNAERRREVRLERESEAAKKTAGKEVNE